MNTKSRLSSILLPVVLGTACQVSPALAGDDASTTNSLVGAYNCVKVNVHLVIEPDGKYVASVQQLPPSGVQRENGVWEAKGGELILQRRSGGIGFSIRRLRPDLDVSGRLLWIFPAGHVGGGAITYPIFQREI